MKRWREYQRGIKLFVVFQRGLPYTEKDGKARGTSKGP